MWTQNKTSSLTTTDLARAERPAFRGRATAPKSGSKTEDKYVETPLQDLSSYIGLKSGSQEKVFAPVDSWLILNLTWEVFCPFEEKCPFLETSPTIWDKS